MKSISIILTALFISVAISGCGPTVDAQKTTQKDLSSYQTFAYLPNSNAELPGKAYNDENVNNAIIAVVNDQMRDSGYNLDRDKPDLLVLMSIKTDIEKEVSRDPVYATYPYSVNTTSVSPYYNNYYYRGYNTYSGVVGYDRNVNRYEEGTVIIDLIDRESKEVVWTAVSTDAIYDQSTTSKVQEMVKAVFEEYPIQ